MFRVYLRGSLAEGLSTSLLSENHFGSTARPPPRRSPVSTRLTVGGRFKELGSIKTWQNITATLRYVWWVRLFRNNLLSPHSPFLNVVDHLQWRNTVSIHCGFQHKLYMDNFGLGRAGPFASAISVGTIFTTNSKLPPFATSFVPGKFISVCHFLELFLLGNYATRSRYVLHVA